MNCDKETLLSGGLDGDDGPFVVRAECDGPPSCGWSIDLLTGDRAWGVTSSEMAALHAAHKYGTVPIEVTLS